MRSPAGVLMPVADGSYESFMSVLDPAASSSWAQKMTVLVDSIVVTPVTDDAQTGDAGEDAQVGDTVQLAAK